MTKSFEMWYSRRVHTSFYASGFLYHSPSQQILLQQFTNGSDIKFVLFGGTSKESTNPKAVFQKCVEKALGVAISPSSIHQVYDYIHDKLGKHFIFYVEVTRISPEVLSSKNKTAWLLLSKLSKCNMSEQTRHDIMIGERVIRSRMEPPRTSFSPKRH